MLTDRYLKGVPNDSRAANGQWMNANDITDDYLQRARALNEIAQSRGQSLAQIALTWVLRNEGVTSAVVGASSVRQLEQSLLALDSAPLEAGELELIEPLARPFDSAQ